MAGILEYALSLKTSGFTSPLHQAEGQLKKFESATGSSSAALAGLTGVAAGAATGFSLMGAAAATAHAVLSSYAEYDGLVKGMESIERSTEGARNRIALLRETAKVPGLGFEEAVRGDIRLRAVGMSSELSEKSLRAFGNALATVGGGKADLDGVILALTQMAAKGKVSAEEINQIGERVPQVRAAMKSAFGTGDTEELAKSGLSVTQVIEGLVNELDKLPKVTSGAQNALDNYDDSWKQLKTSVTEFITPAANGVLNEFARGFSQASKDIQKLKELMGGAPAGDEKKAQKASLDESAALAKQAEADQLAALDREQAAAARDNANYRARLDDERLAAEKIKAEERVKINKDSERRIQAAQEKVYAARLTEETDLQRRIDALKAKPHTIKEFDATPDINVRAGITENIAELVTLEKQLKDLRATAAEKEETLKKAAEAKALAASKEFAAQKLAASLFDSENAILEARDGHHEKLAQTLERELKVQQLKLELMDKQGLSEEEAAAAAEKRIRLEERAADPRKRRGLLDAAASAAATLERANARAAANPKAFVTQADRLALAAMQRRFNPEEAAKALARGNPAADPGRIKREAKAEVARNAQDAAAKAQDPMFRLVKSIEDKFTKLATA